MNGSKLFFQSESESGITWEVDGCLVLRRTKYDWPSDPRSIQVLSGLISQEQLQIHRVGRVHIGTQRMVLDCSL